jgi:hypothetical protein
MSIECNSDDRQLMVERIALGLFSFALLLVQPQEAAYARSGANIGVNSSSMMAVQRDRQEKIKTCYQLHPNFDSDSMTYVDSAGRRHSCP